MSQEPYPVYFHVLFIISSIVLIPDLPHARCPGPDTIKGLRGTIAKLELSVRELRDNVKLKRFNQLQRQLEEADKAKYALSKLLTRNFGVDDVALQVCTV